MRGRQFSERLKYEIVGRPIIDTTSGVSAGTVVDLVPIPTVDNHLPFFPSVLVGLRVNLCIVLLGPEDSPESKCHVSLFTGHVFSTFFFKGAVQRDEIIYLNVRHREIARYLIQVHSLFYYGKGHPHFG